MTLILYGVKQSRAARCLWLLEELGVPFVQVPINVAQGQGDAPSFRTLNPSGKVPVLLDGDFVLRESIAINHYLAARQPTPLWPDALRARASIDQWSCWAVTEMEIPITQMVREKRRAAAAGEEARADVIDPARSTALATVKLLELHLAAGAEYVAADNFTLGDINAVTGVMALRLFVDTTAFPNTAAWLERCMARPAWARVQARE